MIHEIQAAGETVAKQDTQCGTSDLPALPLDTSLREQYRRWFNAHSDDYRKTCGVYGLEFRIRVDVPIDVLAEMMRDAGVEPTIERLDMLIAEMQDQFGDKHGGSPADVVLDRILDQASLCLDELIENEAFDCKDSE